MDLDRFARHAIVEISHPQVLAIVASRLGIDLPSDERLRDALQDFGIGFLIVSAPGEPVAGCITTALKTLDGRVIGVVIVGKDGEGLLVGETGLISNVTAFANLPRDSSRLAIADNFNDACRLAIDGISVIIEV